MRLDMAARAYNEGLKRASEMPSGEREERLRRLNESLQRAEQALLLPNGLPEREWYQHALYAPGIYTGYDAKTLPGLREALEAKHWDAANHQARRLALALHNLALQVEEAEKLLRSE
jgi:N-acetylated-alpha-linked acidic dipeptidase